jgi:hypothetical protein
MKAQNVSLSRVVIYLCLLVIDPGLGVQFGLELAQLVFLQIPGNFAVGIIQIAENPHSGQASRHAGRLFSFFHELYAEAALLDIAFFFDDPDMIRAGHDAIAAPDAPLPVHQDDPFFLQIL